ncbi:hypothetical protein Tco_1529457 [Tanacetum coccineum]
MEQMTTLCDLVGQAIQKKEEETRIVEEQAAKDRYWKIPICYDDDEDDTPVNSLSMGDKHLDTISETESDEFIKSSVEDLVPIPSESEGIPDKMCDVPLCENTTPLNALNEHSEIVVNSDDDNRFHLKSRLSTIRTHVSINTLIIFHKLRRVFHNNTFVVKIAGVLMRLFNVNH